MSIQGILRVGSDGRIGLGVVITKAGAARYRRMQIQDPAAYFKDKVIRVTGTVILKEKRPRLEVDDAERCAAPEPGSSPPLRERVSMEHSGPDSMSFCGPACSGNHLSPARFAGCGYGLVLIAP
jgi:hypothetical protein